MAKLARQWRSSVAARGGGDGNENWAGEQVEQARGGVHVMASSARTAAARGGVVRRPATSVTHMSIVFWKRSGTVASIQRK